MPLINFTKNIVLAQDVFIAKTILARARGLLGRKIFSPQQALILDSCNSVHTFFMHFPIDIIFVDKNYKVIKLISNFKPNRISKICWHASKVIELPSGVLNATKTQLHDQLQVLG
ncbi:MAG: DUF192 domain-containing protein [Candidatus Omnitrophota bacterium]